MRTFALRVAVGVGAATAVFLSTPAHAAGPDFDALGEVDAAGTPVTYQVKPGEVVPATIGVANVTDAPIQGAVINIRTVNDSDLLEKYENCAYYTDSNLDGAWCEFDTELAAGATYALSDQIISITDEPTYKPSTVNFRWYSRAYAAEQGGIDGLAKSHSGANTTTRRGSGSTLALTAHDLVRREEPGFLNFVYLKVIAPSPSASASASASAPSSPTPPSASDPTPSSSSSPTPAATPTDTSGTGGGLPVTGTNTTLVAVAGAALLLAGALGFTLSRRRTRFIP